MCSLGLIYINLHQRFYKTVLPLNNFIVVYYIELN